jgi:hypothetical protein
MSEDCERMQDKIADCIFGALSRQDNDALNEHVAGCSKCRQYMQALSDEKSLLREFAEKVDAGMEPRKERLAKAVERCKPGERTKLRPTWRTIVQSRFAKLAVAAGLLIVAGYLAGRLLPSRSADIQQLQAALEASLRSSLERGIHGSLIEQVNRDRELALERHYMRLRDELARQSRHEMNELARMTLAASRTATEQRLEELIRLIEAARTIDHLQVERALDLMESSRLEDRTRFGEGLVSLATLKNEGLPNNR